MFRWHLVEHDIESSAIYNGAIWKGVSKAPGMGRKIISKKRIPKRVAMILVSEYMLRNQKIVRVKG
jgi:hypothetical protein